MTEVSRLIWRKNKVVVSRMIDFAPFCRNRLHLMPRQAFYLLINNGGMSSMSLTMVEIYKDHKDEDGFLYITYASQEMFGSPGGPCPRGAVTR